MNLHMVRMLFTHGSRHFVDRGESCYLLPFPNEERKQPSRKWQALRPGKREEENKENSASAAE